MSSPQWKADSVTRLQPFFTSLAASLRHLKAAHRMLHAAEAPDQFWGMQGAGVVFRASDTGRILLLLRSALVNEPNTWSTVGGKVDPGETPKEAAIREVDEEIGYRGPLRLKPLFVFKKGDFRYFNYLAMVPHEFEPRHSWESSGHVWTTLDELPKPLHFGFKALLPHLAAKLGDL